VWRLPYAVGGRGGVFPSFAAVLSGRSGAPKDLFIPDYSIDPGSIPTVSAADVLNGRADPRLIRGKELVIGSGSEVIGDQFFIPGTGTMSGANVHIIGAARAEKRDVEEDSPRAGIREGVRQLRMITARPWPAPDLAERVIVDFDKYDVAAGRVAMEAVAAGAEQVLGDFAEADQAEDQAGDGRPQKQLPWRHFGLG
jgi:hypothetical protein